MFRVIARLMLTVEIKTPAAPGDFNKTNIFSFNNFQRFGFCGEDAGYCYPIEGCILRGVEIDGGDLTVAEGGGGVNVDRGQLDGCAYICEENSLCGWYTYDKTSNQCFLKGTRGFLSNKTQTATIISGSTQSGGCTFNPREEGTAAASPNNPARRRRRRRCRFPYRRYGRRCIHYCQVPKYCIIQ